MWACHAEQFAQPASMNFSTFPVVPFLFWCFTVIVSLLSHISPLNISLAPCHLAGRASSHKCYTGCHLLTNTHRTDNSYRFTAPYQNHIFHQFKVGSLVESSSMPTLPPLPLRMLLLALPTTHLLPMLQSPPLLTHWNCHHPNKLSTKQFHTLEHTLFELLETLQSVQYKEWGFCGHGEQLEEYKLKFTMPWVGSPNSGPHCELGLNAAGTFAMVTGVSPDIGANLKLQKKDGANTSS